MGGRCGPVDGVAHLIEQWFDVRYHSGHARRVLRKAELDSSPARGCWSATKAPLPNGRGRVGRHQRTQKKAARSSSSTKADLASGPHRCRTWAPRVKTLALQYHFHSKIVSLADLLLPDLRQTDRQERSRAVPGECAPALCRSPDGGQMGRLPAHRGRLIVEFLDYLQG